MFRLEAALPRDRWCSRFLVPRGEIGIIERKMKALLWGRGVNASWRKGLRLVGSWVWRLHQRDQIGLVAR